MNRYIGHLFNTFEWPVPDPQTYVCRDVEYKEWSTETEDSIQASPLHHTNQVVPGHEFMSERFLGYEDTHLYNRLWIFPSSVDAGLIATQYIIPVAIWNAYRDQNMTISSVTATSLDNTVLNLGTLPRVLVNDEYDGECSLTIENTGDAELFGYFTIIHTLAPLSFRFDVQGIRIIVLPILGNWEGKYQIRYSMMAVIARTKTLYEQRKSLYEVPRRSIDLRDFFQNPQKIVNMMQFAINHCFAIPVATERITPNTTGSLQGLTSIPVVENLTTTCFNFSLSTHVLLYNDLTSETEVRALAETPYSAGAVNFTIGVVADWDASEVTIYPVLFCYTDDVSIEDITDNVAKIGIGVKEFVRSSYHNG